MKKERSAAQKLATYKRALRDAWHRCPMYWEAYNRAKVSPGVIKCERCGTNVNSKLMQMDHVQPVCAPGQDPADIALWAFRLNCPAAGLQALCESCHARKTGSENSKRVKGPK